jgi:L-lactate dehydrogenase
MKVGVIGVGAVGSACTFAMIERGSAREIVLVDKVRARAVAIATDMRYGAPLSPAVDIHAGDYPDLAGANLVMIAAGINEKAGGATNRGDPEGRLRLLETNAAVYQEIIPQVVEAAPQAVLMVVTDPPDPLADLTRSLAGHERVFSTGTMIDSLRFRVHLAERLGVTAAAIDAWVVGEHGTTAVFLWSSATVGGMSVLEAMEQRGEPLEEIRKSIERSVRFANITIIEGNNASQFGIGVVSARLAEAVLREERGVFAVAAYQPAYGVSLSLPSVVGRSGVLRTLIPSMSVSERRGLERSADALRKAGERIAEGARRTA